MVPVFPVLEKKESKEKIISLLNVLPDKIDFIEGKVEEKDEFFELSYKSLLKYGFPKKSYSGVLSIKEDKDEEFFVVSLSEKLDIRLHKYNLSKFKSLDKKEVNVDLYLAIHPSTEIIVNNFSNKIKKDAINSIYLYNVFAYVDINNRLVIQSFADILLTKTNNEVIISKFKTLDFLGNLIVSYSGFFMVTYELLSDDYKEILNGFSEEEKLLPNKTRKNNNKEIVEKIGKINSEIKDIRKETKRLFNKLQEMYHLVLQDFVDNLIKEVKEGDSE